MLANDRVNITTNAISTTPPPPSSSAMLVHSFANFTNSNDYRSSSNRQVHDNHTYSTNSALAFSLSSMPVTPPPPPQTSSTSSHSLISLLPHIKPSSSLPPSTLTSPQVHTSGNYSFSHRPNYARAGAYGNERALSTITNFTSYSYNNNNNNANVNANGRVQESTPETVLHLTPIIV